MCRTFSWMDAVTCWNLHWLPNGGDKPVQSACPINCGGLGGEFCYLWAELFPLASMSLC